MNTPRPTVLALIAEGHTHVAWTMKVHRLRRWGKTACGMEIPSPALVGAVGYYKGYPAVRSGLCGRCRRAR